jgi:soluble lytic murein transglycosylase-like protein
VKALGQFALLMLLGVPAHAAEQALLRNGFSITFEAREVSGANTRLYLTPGRDSYVDVATTEIQSYADAPPAPLRLASPPAIAPDLHTIVTEAAARHELDPDLINSVIHAESSFNAKAVSNKGARGLMQLMPATALQLGVTDSFDATANVNGGTKHLHQLLVQNNYDLAKALAAYNAGQHRVQQYRGVPPYRETRTYVSNIIREFNRKKRAQQSLARSAKLTRPSTAAQGGMR